MTEPSHDLDESYVDRYDEADSVRDRTEVTEMLLLEENSPEASRRLPYLLVLTSGGAG